MNLQATWASEIDEPRGATMKFTYPSGSRPLAGYTIKRGVGQGGFGEVYYALSDGGKEVALKLVRRNLNVEVRGVSQCLNLKHPNLVALYDIRQDDTGDSWVIMEYVGGESLEDLVLRHPQGLPREVALHWMQGICAAVGYLHDQGIVHRDLKPGNIFNDDGVVKLGDYGLSKFISASRRSGQTESVGTVHYMAPEVANGRYGKEIDIYALGILCYELLTGRVPFEGESVGEVLMKHLTAQPDLSALEEPYQSIVRRALDKDPARRLSSVGEFVTSLGLSTASNAAAFIGAQPQVQPILFAARVENSAATEGPTAATANHVSQAEATSPPPSAVGEAFRAANAGEPIFQAVSSACRSMWRWIDNPNMPLLPRMALLIVGLTGAIILVSVALPLLIVVAALYFVYLILWAIFWAPWVGGAPWPNQTRGPTPAPPPPVPQPPTSQPAASGPAAATVPQFVAAQPSPPPQTPGQAASPRPGKLHRTVTYYASRREAKAAMLLKTPREQVTELLGSLVLSALVVAAVAVLGATIAKVHQPEVIAWLTGVSVIGAWGVLIPAKFWEGTTGEPMMRRLVLFCVGLGVAMFAYTLASALMLDASYSSVSHRVGGEVSRVVVPIGEAARSNGNPRLSHYLFFFGAIFPALRWWKQADPLRAERVSLWNIACCGLAGYIVAQICEFPDIAGLLVAVTMAVAIQLSSPWVGISRTKAAP